jgi:hypothetical protein
MKKAKKERKPPRTFAQRLAEELRDSGLGQVTVCPPDEDDGGWVKIQKGTMLLEFSFDEKGKIDRFGLWQEVWEVVDQHQVFAFNGERKPQPIKMSGDE